MFIVVCIGCLECYIPSELVGAFATEVEAKCIADKLTMLDHSPDRDYQVFKVGKLGEIHEDYKELALDKTNT